MNGIKPTIAVTSISHPPFGTNTYLLTKEGRAGCLVVDPGGWGGRHVEEAVLRLGREVEFVVLTHEHFDHVGGVPALLERWPCRVVCSRECSSAMADPMRNFSRYMVDRDVACEAKVTCCEDLGGRLPWNGAELRFISTPGHSPGSICITVENLLFAGDTLLWGRKRPINLPGGDKQELRQSVSLLFRILSPDTLVYPGHGEPFVLRQAQAGLSAPRQD
jgi:glyoxylase-like metal-dependent hydrolase (beta-lactamase superfamily II)